MLGAAVVGVLWLVLGNGGGSTASFQVSPGIPPVVFLYLDDVHIASYLAQLQGGEATTEMLSRQATESRNASVASHGIGVGASTGELSTAQLSLTITDQSRFTDLLGLLKADGYLRTIDMGAPDAEVRQEFAPVTPGTFVRLSDCTLALPRYVQAEQLWRAARGRINIEDVLAGGGAHFDLVQSTAYQAFEDRQRAQGLPPGHVPIAQGQAIASIAPERLARARSELDGLVKRVGANPRVPLDSCSPGGYDPNVPDLLMPIRLGELSSGEGALAGQVTLIGKVMLAVHGRIQMEAPGSHGDYVDLASIQQWSGASLWTSGQDGLADNATVLGPGYVIQPIAIYK